MMLRSFEVRGFKNLMQPVKLDGLGPINVIHGPNNVGKSNLLQAMQVFFHLIGLQGVIEHQQHDGVKPAFDEQLHQIGIEPIEIFNLERPIPIIFKVEVEVGREELERAGMDGTVLSEWAIVKGRPDISVSLERADLRVALEVEVQLLARSVTCRLNDLVVNEQEALRLFKGARLRVSSEGVLDLVRQFLSFLSRNFAVKSQSIDRFALIGVDRLSRTDLALELYDAKESAELEQAMRWERFLDAMSAFKDLLGEGVFVTTYDRKTSKANLFYQTSFARIPLRLLGSGVQQSVALIGQLLMTNASLVAIEEPELNMRYTLQERLRDVFKQKIVGAPGGPAQLFLTSHSPAFESGPHFYLMTPTPQGPKVEARAIEQARVAVGFPEDVMPPGDNAARCYLSTEGVVRVPERIREALGLPNGGGVMFLENKGHVEMISDERFAAMLDATEGGEGHEQS